MKHILHIIFILFLFQNCFRHQTELTNSFITLNDNLIKAENEFQSNSANDVKKAKKGSNTLIWHNKALKVELMTKNIINFLVLETSQMIEEVEMKPWHIIDSNGYYVLKNLSNIKDKDNFIVPTNRFVKQNNGAKGMAIRQQLHSFRDSICIILANYNADTTQWEFKLSNSESLVSFNTNGDIIDNTQLDVVLLNCNPLDRAKIKQIYILLSQPKVFTQGNKSYTWQAQYFEHAPIVAACAILTAFKVDIRYASSMAIDMLYEK